MKYFVAAAFLIAAASAVSLDFQPSQYSEHPAFSGERKDLRIVGGNEVPPHRVPYQAGIYAGNSFCGGSLINARYVLTSAHCGELSEHPIVVLGAHRIKDKEPEQVSLVASKVIVHPHWDRKYFINDVALIMLPQNVRYTNAISPINIAPPQSGSYENEQARVTGWGVMREHDTEMSPTLRYVLNPIMANRECQRRLPEVSITDYHLCISGEGGRSPCLGDAGAPVVSAYQNDIVQVGIVSFMMESACQRGFPVGLTRVSQYYYWIQSNI